MREIRPVRRITIALTSMLVLGVAAGPALGATFHVDIPGSSADKIKGDGNCADAAGHCSLQAAIEEGNFLAGTHTIDFQVPAVTLTASLPQVRAQYTIGNLVTKTVINGAGVFDCFNLTDSGDATSGHDLGADGTTIQNLVIQGCHGDGIAANGHGYQFLNNFIGTNALATSAVPNSGHGISISASRVYSQETNAFLQTLFDEIQSILPAQPLDDVAISSFASQLSTYMANVGLGPVKIAGNVISGNGQNGLEIFSENLAGVWVTANMIGTDLTGNAAIPNGGSGVHLIGNCFGEIIGPANVISGNTHMGIDDGSLLVSIPNFVMGNRIGLALADPAAVVGNGESGIRADTKPDTTTSGHINPSGISLVVASNVISGNLGTNNPDPDILGTHAGVVVTGSSDGVKIQGNTIGIGDFPPGTHLSSRLYGNLGDGIIVTSKGTTIGGSSPGEGNVIAANARNGLVISGSSITGTVVVGNSIGIDPALANDLTLGNGADGIHVDGASASFIGAPDNNAPGPTDFNTIAANGINGVKIRNGGYNNGWGNLLRRNVIYGNGVLGFGVGIDLDYLEDGENPQHGEFPFNYANLDQAQPVIQTAQDAGGQTSVTWTLTTHGPGLPTTYRLEIFRIDAPSVDAATSMTFLGESTVTTDAGGALPCPGSPATCTTTVPGASGGGYVVMTATDITTIPDTPQGGWSNAIQCIVLSNCQVNDTSELSNAVSSTVVPVSTTTAVTTVAPGTGAAGNAVYGQPVSVTATVTATSGALAPTGAVNVQAGASSCMATLGAPAGLAASGTCVLAPAPSVAGSPYVVTASYGGDAHLSASSSAGVADGTLAVSKAATALSITGHTPEPSLQGAPIAITIALAVQPPGTGAPGGTVTVDDGTGDQCVVALPATGCALVPTTTGAKTLTAHYPGDADFAAGDSPGVAHQVDAAGATPTTTAVTQVSPGSGTAGASVFGETVTVTASVHSTTTGVPDGSVLFTAGGASCSAALTPLDASTASASCPLVPALAPGNYTVIAAYSGSAAFAVSSSDPGADGSLAVSQASTSLSILTDLSSPTNVNAPIPITVSFSVVPPGAGSPTGTITVSDGTDSCPIVLPATGCTLTPTTTGLKQVTASYGGDASFAGVASAPVPHQVNSGGAIATATVVQTVNPTNAVFGQPIQVTVAVTAQSGSAAPTGNVTVTLTPGPSGCLATLGASATTTATGTCTVAPAPAVAGGAYAISAGYAGSATFAASSSSSNGSVTVTKASTTTAITGHTPNPSNVNAPILITAHVTPTPPAGGTPTGTIGVTDGTASCTITLPGTTCNLTPTTAGSKQLVATYSGDGSFVGSNNAPGVSHTVNPGGAVLTTTTVSLVNPPTAVFGQPVAVTASVHAQTGSAAPTGNVTMSAGGSSCIAALGPSGSTTATATCTLAPPPGANASPYTVSAGYAGTATFAASSGSNGALTVSQASTTLAIVGHTPSPSTLGVAIKVTVQLQVSSPGAGTPTGTITVGDGTVSCNVTLPTTFCNLTPTTTGPHTLIATYGGDANFAAATSPGVTHNVNSNGAVSTSTVVSSVTPAAIVYGQPVSATASVTALGGAVAPNGIVTITAGSSVCAAALGSPVGLTSKATCTPAPALLPAGGAYPVSASFGGTPTFAASASSGAGNKSLDVSPAATTTTIGSNVPSTSFVLAPVMVSVAVQVTAPGTGAPSGTVLVDDGTGDSCTITLPSTSCNLVPTSAGVKTLTAHYGGDARFLASTSAGVTQTVNLMKTFSGPTSTPGVTGTVTLSGGLPSCTLVHPQFIPVPPLVPPSGVSFPFGLFDFSTANCGAGQTVSIQIVYSQPLPNGAQYWKFGPTPGGGPNTVDHWYAMPNVTAGGSTVTFHITDGDVGDDDLIADGAIQDQGGPAAVTAPVVPTLDGRGLLLLALLFAGLGWKLLRR